ncbi:MAG TPA: ATP-grasp domain-containing protein, partial [Arenicellales bacterium]|nr:ATP-grasp domain-containing protein [Arenicellales bacterium]
MKQAKRVLLIAPYGSYRTAAYVKIAKQLGFDCIVGSTGYHAVSHVPGSTIINLDLGSVDLDLERLQKQHDRTAFHGVIATDDSVVEIAAELAKRLHLPGNSVEAVRRTCRKDLLKNAFLNSTVLSPSGFEVRLDRPFETQISFSTYPCVAKPLTLSASRGVIRADNPGELKAALARIWRLIQKEGEDKYPIALVERFIPGKEIAVEGLLLNGVLSILAIFDKPIPLNGPYFEETIYVTPSALSDAEQQEVKRVLSRACECLELRQGPVHAECRLNEQGIWIIDIASRSIGGQCGQLIKAGTGVTLEEMIVRNSVGESTT